MAKAHDRILEIALTCDEGDDTTVITAVNYYRHRGQLIDTNPRVLTITAGSAAANHETEMGEAVPPPTIIRLKSSFVS